MILLENYLEDTMDAVELEQYPGNVALSAIKRNPSSVILANECGKYYVAASDVETYMEASHQIDAAKALSTIAEANGLNIADITVVVDEACEFVIETLSEAGIMLEKAAEADSMGLKQAMKWYSKFVEKSKKVDKETSKQMIQERIDVLENCIKTMEAAKKDAVAGVNKSGQIKYALKSLIPFNSIFRVIKKQDAYAAMGHFKDMAMVFRIWLHSAPDAYHILSRNAKSNFAKKAYGFGEEITSKLDTNMSGHLTAGLAGTAFGIRLATYDKMLDGQIARTKKAVEFLKEKLKEIER